MRWSPAYFDSNVEAADPFGLDSARKATHSAGLLASIQKRRKPSRGYSIGLGGKQHSAA